MKDEDRALEQISVHPALRTDRGVIDWSEIHRRLETSQAALERRLNPGPDERRKVLKARAKLLARESEDREPVAASIEIVEFLLANEHYAFESGFVREIHPLKDFTSLPCTPPFVLGLINVRGQILSVVDIKKFFDLPEKGLTDLNKVIVLQMHRMELGVLADAILGVRPVPLHDLQPSLPTLSGIRLHYLRGVTKDSLVVLDAERLLSDSQIVVDEGAGRAT